MIYGPFTFENAPIGSVGAQTYYRYKKWHRSKPVGREECPYESREARLFEWKYTRWRFSSYSTLCYDQVSLFTHGSDPRRTTLSNRCYAKLMERVRGEHGGVQGLTFLAEMNESLRMVTTRSLQFARAARDLRQGRFRDFLGRWGVKPLPKHKDLKRTKAKEASGLWLEYWFGWAPSLNDVYNAVNVLQQPIPAQRFKARSTLTEHLAEDIAQFRRTCEIKMGVGMRATVTVSNPNLWLANQLGLINPAQTALELIPFSWLLGWWVNVSQVLGALTDWFGLNVTRASTTYYAAATGFQNSYDPYWKHSAKVEAYSWVRTLGIAKPILKITGLSGLSVTRAATSVSLLVQLFISTNKGR